MQPFLSKIVSSIKRLKPLVLLSFLLFMIFIPSGYAAAESPQPPFWSLGDRRAHAYSSEGIRFMSQERFADAAHYFQMALSRQPQNTSYLTLLAWSYFKLNQYDKALEVFKKIKELDPFILDGYTGPGWIHFKTAQYDQAVQYFQEALMVDQESSDAFAGLGWCYIRKNEARTAKASLETALQKGLKNSSGTEPEAHRALGYLYFGQNNFKEALKHFKIAVHHMPSWRDARIKWGDCLFSLGKHKKSIKVYKYALRHEKTAEIYDKIGWAFFYAKPAKFFGSPKKNLEQARSMFTRALAIDSSYANSQAGLEAVKNKMKDMALGTTSP